MRKNIATSSLPLSHSRVCHVFFLFIQLMKIMPWNFPWQKWSHWTIIHSSRQFSRTRKSCILKFPYRTLRKCLLFDSSSSSGESFIQCAASQQFLCEYVFDNGDVVEGNGVNDVKLRLYLLFFVSHPPSHFLPLSLLLSSLAFHTPKIFFIAQNELQSTTQKRRKKYSILHWKLSPVSVSLSFSRVSDKKKK